MSEQVIYRIQQAYEHLSRAEQKHQPVSPLTDIYPDLTIDEAYQVQMSVIRQKVQDGQRIVGKKIGLTSLAMQKLLGVDQPDYGHLLESMEIPNRGNIGFDRVFQPKVEAELAFILKRDLQGPNITVEDVLKATEYVVPALEIVDSRIQDWKIQLQDTIADNASSGLYVLGDQKIRMGEMDLSQVEMHLFRNGERMNTGYGSAALGDPAICVAWLANKLSEYGVMLKAGEVILSGALSAAVNAHKGDQFVAEFTNLGKVEVRFS